ncbi:ATP-binding protein [Spirochaeta dissipatitropha]
MSTSEHAYVDIKFGPCWKYISVTRSYVQNFIAVGLAGQVKADKIAMAVSELLENAVKYSAGDDTRVRLEVKPEDGKIVVAVSNKTEPGREEELRAIYKRVNSGDPLQVYIEMMREATVRTDGKSQLGLARIRHEVGADIQLDISDDHVVTVRLDIDVEMEG